MRRRDLLKLGGTLLAGALLEACSTGERSSKGHSLPTSNPTSSSAGPSTSTTSPRRGPPDWSGLSRKLDGDLFTPSSAQYPSLAMPYNPVFDQAHPEALAYVGSSGDVASSIAFARHYGIPLSIRSGGHCYGGWSTGTGLVIDVTHLDAVTVQAGAVDVGSGTRLVDLYAALGPHGIAIPGGSCPTVGIAGLTMGGGLGVVDRKLGLTCDRLVSADVVLADGQTVTCDATTNSDLLWALRGGGGGNFGVVTRFGFSPAAVPSTLAIFTLVWEWSAAPSVVAAWQQWAPGAPDELWSNCLLLASQETPSGYGAVARVTGVYMGGESELEAELSTLLAAVAAPPFNRFVGTNGYLDTMLIEGGCGGDTVAQCHLPSVNPAGVLTRAPFAAKSDIVTTLLPQSGVTALLAAVAARQSSSLLSGGGIALDAAGGAINAIGPTETAFVHRDALFTMQYSANWSQGAPRAVVDANQSWLTSAWGSMRPYVSGQAYQNYIDPSLSGWKTAYYGQNLRRLEQVKARYDPSNVFHFPQSIPEPS